MSKVLSIEMLKAILRNGWIKNIFIIKLLIISAYMEINAIYSTKTN